MDSPGDTRDAGKDHFDSLARHQGGRTGLIGQPARHQGGTREAGKGHLDSREAPGRQERAPSHGAPWVAYWKSLLRRSPSKQEVMQRRVEQTTSKWVGNQLVAFNIRTHEGNNEEVSWNPHSNESQPRGSASLLPMDFIQEVSPGSSS